MKKSLLILIFTMACALSGNGERLFASEQTTARQLTANDISFLWPVPTTVEEVTRLIAADSKLGDGQTNLWPLEVFQQIISKAPEIVPTGETGPRITFPSDAQLAALSTWKVAGIRIDPSAPGCDARLIAAVGSTPQIRLILQPVTVDSNGVKVHDFAAHLAFDFTKASLAISPSGQTTPAVADNGAFKEVVADLLALKQTLQGMGISTDGQMGVHPGFLQPDAGLTEKLRAVLVKHLRADRLNNVAFMGVRRPEPWLFILFRRTAQGFDVLPQRIANGSLATMFSRTARAVVPEPQPTTFGTFGVSTVTLLRNPNQLDQAATSTVVPGIGRAPTNRDIVDVVANPRFANVGNTDCVSCHTESALRNTIPIATTSSDFAFPAPKSFAGVSPDVIANNLWNVRNYGWGVVTGQAAKPTIAVRTGNEAAESAEFINREYLTASSVLPSLTPTTRPIVNPLTLIVTAKTDADFGQLQQKLNALQSLPLEANPIFQALERLGNVHDARFVFLPNNQLAVVTTYDDDFDAYIDLFVDEIGDVFNIILAHVKDAPPGRVQDNREAFRAFVRANDVAPTGVMYSAYPTLRVRDIKDLKRAADAKQ